ncbi:MAG: nicotinate phosphoribosyltransferase [Acidobacteria bacterium]|nr:nicotinate phosphoribosyltransferase [Acidobacteriota bacterium]
MLGLLTDLYQLTMAAGYHESGKTGEVATFELFVRRLPPNRNFIVAAGLAQAVDYLLNLHFEPPELAYLRSLRQFQNVAPGFFDFLAGLRFTGDLFAVPEGTPLFAGEPILTVRAPIVEAQLVETYLLATIGFQTLIATKAWRIATTAGSRSVVEFGTRRAHSPEAGVLAGRAAYIGGCAGTSNTETGFRYGVPVYGTAAHSWVQSFADEEDSYRHLQKLLGEATVYLIDTYDTLDGAHKAAALGRPLWGVRLDSGNLVELSRKVRAILDGAGLHDAKIMATGDLNEYKILELMSHQVPIDAFGVGTSLATSDDAPHLGAVYKLVEIQAHGARRYTAKFSEGKLTLPGAKQVFRYNGFDLIGRTAQSPTPGPDGEYPEALLEPVVIGGTLARTLPDAAAARRHALASVGKLPAATRSLFEGQDPYRVEYTPELLELLDEVRHHKDGVLA